MDSFNNEKGADNLIDGECCSFISSISHSISLSVDSDHKT